MNLTTALAVMLALVSAVEGMVIRRVGDTMEGKNWRSIFCSIDGSKCAAVVHDGNIWRSTDSAQTWTEVTSTDSEKKWTSITCSADGSKCAATVDDGNIWRSTDSAQTWSEVFFTPSIDTYGNKMSSARIVTCSADGSKCVALVANGILYHPSIWRSTDSARTWTPVNTMGGNKYWRSISCSADGSICAAGMYNGNIWRSTDSAQTWTEVTSTDSEKKWTSITCSADGSKCAATVDDGNIWRSTDSAQTWTKVTNTFSERSWASITCTADGSICAAVVSNGNIWRSTDSAQTWTEVTSTGGTQRWWKSITCSADGSICAAVVSNANIWRSTNSAQTWTDVLRPPVAQTFALLDANTIRITYDTDLAAARSCDHTQYSLSNSHTISACTIAGGNSFVDLTINSGRITAATESFTVSYVKGVGGAATKAVSAENGVDANDFTNLLVSNAFPPAVISCMMNAGVFDQHIEIKYNVDVIAPSCLPSQYTRSDKFPITSCVVSGKIVFLGTLGVSRSTSAFTLAYSPADGAWLTTVSGKVAPAFPAQSVDLTGVPVISLMPAIIAIAATSLVGTAFGLIRAALQKEEKVKSNEDMFDEESPHIIKDTIYKWADSGIQYKLCIDKHNKILLTGDGGSNPCCPRILGSISNVEDVAFVQTSLNSPGACFVNCGPRYGWTVFKFTLWATIGNFGLHRLAILPSPYSRGTRCMVVVQLILGVAIFVLPTIPLHAAFTLARLVDMVLVFAWKANWTVRIHFKGGKPAIEAIMTGADSEKNSKRLRQELFHRMKAIMTGILTGSENELDTFLYPETAFVTEGSCKRSVSTVRVGQYHLQMTTRSNDYLEYTDVFLTSLESLNYICPGTYPWWYIFSNWVPPWGCFGCHRHALGERKLPSLLTYFLSFGYFTCGWCVDGYWIFRDVERIMKKGTLELSYAGGHSFFLNVQNQDAALGFIHQIRAQLGFLYDKNGVPHGPAMAQGRDFPHPTSLTERICGAKEVLRHSSAIERDQIVIKNSLEVKQLPCIYPSLCFPVCWMGKVFPVLCCLCKKCCMIVVKNEETNVLYLKKVREYNTQQDSCDSKCCCCKGNHHYVYFPNAGVYAHLQTKKQVAETVRLLNRNTIAIAKQHYIAPQTNVPMIAIASRLPAEMSMARNPMISMEEAISSAAQ